MRYIGKFVFLLIPIFFVVALIRLQTGNGFSIPSAADMLVALSAIGSNDDLIAAVNGFNASKDTLYGVQVVDFITFFTAIGSFFSMIGNALGVFFQIIAVPFRVLGWLFGLMSL